MFANTALVRTECLQTFPLVRGRILYFISIMTRKKVHQAGLNTRPHGIIGLFTVNIFQPFSAHFRLHFWIIFHYLAEKLT
jgi:hypothetical protein